MMYLNELALLPLREPFSISRNSILNRVFGNGKPNILDLPWHYFAIRPGKVWIFIRAPFSNLASENNFTISLFRSFFPFPFYARLATWRVKKQDPVKKLEWEGSISPKVKVPQIDSESNKYSILWSHSFRGNKSKASLMVEKKKSSAARFFSAIWLYGAGET